MNKTTLLPIDVVPARIKNYLSNWIEENKEYYDEKFNGFSIDDLSTGQLMILYKEVTYIDERSIRLTDL
jgi:hypothetical protein